MKEFLTSLSKFADLYIYTHAEKEYARAIVAWIDPEKKLFNDKIITNEMENRGKIKKSLDYAS